MISVERISEFINDTIPPTSDWPKTSAITFENVRFKYSRGSPIVLNKVNFEIENGQHIGIIGIIDLSSINYFLLKVNL